MKDGTHVTISNHIMASTSYSSQTETFSLKFSLERVQVYILLYLHINFHWEINDISYKDYFYIL